MKKLRRLGLLLLAAPLLSACEKEIELEFDEAEARYVIEGAVEPGSGPHEVRISRTVRFTDPNVFPEVENAVVTISDAQGDDEVLQHVGDGIYRSTGALIGAPGHTYTLSVQVEGESITALSTMPQAVLLDSLDADSLGGFGGPNRFVIPRYTDPAGSTNYYRLRGATNSQPWGEVFARDDNFSDGQVNGQPMFNSAGLEPGDTVTVELFCVDAANFTYWFTLEQNSGGPGGSAAPADPTTNLSSNALGYFSAQVRSSQTVLIP